MSVPSLVQRIGKYRIVRLLGQGTTGQVFESVEENIGRRVAIKILRRQSRLDPEIAQRFLTEARAGNRVHHPGLLDIYELGQHPGGMHYIVMEFLHGETLLARLQRHRRLDLEGIHFARQIAAAMAAAHRGGIIHRDLKPGNMMIVRDPECPNGERVKIVDFGLVKLASTPDQPEPSYLTQPGMIMGTPAYMAPEQCRGAADITDRADVYALGTILYMMVAGQPPIQTRKEDSMATLLAAQIYRQPAPLADRAPDALPGLPAFVHRMLAKTPSERPSMTETVAFLDSVLQQMTEPMVMPSITVVPAPALVPPPPPRRSSSRIVAVAAAVLLGVLPVAAVSSRTLGHQPTMALVSDPPPADRPIRELVLPREEPRWEPMAPDATPSTPLPPIRASSPEIALALMKRGQQALQEERWADAEEVLRRSSKLQESSRTMTLWALAQLRIGRHQQARQTALRALQMHLNEAEIISARVTLKQAETKLGPIPPVRR